MCVFWSFLFDSKAAFVQKFIYLFLAARAAHRLSLVVASRGYCSAEVCGLLITVASLVAEHRL